MREGDVVMKRPLRWRGGGLLSVCMAEIQPNANYCCSMWRTQSKQAHMEMGLNPYLHAAVEILAVFQSQASQR